MWGEGTVRQLAASAMVAAIAAQSAAAAEGRFGSALAARARRAASPSPSTAGVLNLVAPLRSRTKPASSTRGGAKSEGSGRKRPARIAFAAALSRAELPDRLHQLQAGDAAVPLDRELEVDVPADAEEHRLGNDPVPVDLVLEPVEPDREVRALRGRRTAVPSAARSPKRCRAARPRAGRRSRSWSVRDSDDGPGGPAGAATAGGSARPSPGGSRRRPPAPPPSATQAGRRRYRRRRRRRLGPLRAVSADGPSRRGRQVVLAAEKDRTLGPVRGRASDADAVPARGRRRNGRRPDDRGSGHRRRRAELPQDLGRRQEDRRTLWGRGGDDFRCHRARRQAAIDEKHDQRHMYESGDEKAQSRAAFAPNGPAPYPQQRTIKPTMQYGPARSPARN